MTETPIYTSLINYMQENNIRLHMPGHVGKSQNLVKELQAIAKIDITEVPGIDDIHLPTGAIKEARELLAKAYGASESLFLVNGATSGIQSIFLALASLGKKVLIPRNSHRSLFAGLVLSGLWPEYLHGETEPNTGLTVSIDASRLAQALEKSPDIKGVFLTSPSYYGTSQEIKSIASLCQRKNILLAVDEAHGSHFPFHPQYPISALEAGADVSVNGLHKSLPVLNQGACLHISARSSYTQEIKMAASLLTTTSPSFPILASIDLARALMVARGEELLEAALNLSKEYKGKINRIKGLKSPTEELKDIKGVADLDPLKILVVINNLSISGYEVAEILRQKYHIQVELASETAILAMFSFFHTKADWSAFYHALKEIARKYYTDQLKAPSPIILPLSQVAISPRQAYFSQKRTIKLKNSLGLIAGEMVAAYPPGIPALLPGELITAEILDYLHYLKFHNVRIQGPQDKDLNNIKVIA